jgi:hypothetical protein
MPARNINIAYPPSYPENEVLKSRILLVLSIPAVILDDEHVPIVRTKI